jgi:hypothetical protein
MASNAGSVMSPATNFDSWIELYNPSDQQVNLAGYYLSNDKDSLNMWRMPDKMGVVPAKGFKVVWLGSNHIKANQAPFKLDCDGGEIFLSDQTGNLITSMEYPQALSRTAYARTTDGGSTWSWTDTPTPGATNATAVFASERLAAPEVSRGSLLFSGSLSFTVTIPEGATLMYTTDGSVPTAPGVSSSVSLKSGDGRFTVSKTTNYVFRLYRDGYLPSVPVTRSFIRPDKTYTVPVISIVGNDRYFNDPMWGIDVNGSNGKTGNGSDVPVNWNMDWDRPVNFSYISPDKGMLFNQDVNISVAGGWSRASVPRSMKLKANKVFDGQNRFDYSFFPQKPYIRSKTLLIRNGGNDVWNYHARFTDPALTTIVQRSGIDLDVQSCVQVIEYVNGSFKGVLNLREPNNDKFVYANHGYDDEEIDMFENTTFTNGTDKTFKHLCDVAKNVNAAGAYEEVKRLVDVDEFCNYMAVELFVGNDDWPENNVKAYRSQKDGRFRFVCYDLDIVFNARGRNTFRQVLDNQSYVDMVSLFINLLKHGEFRRLFIDRFCIVAGSVFDRQRATAIVDELAAAMRPMSQLDGYVPDKAANNIKEKLRTRADAVLNRLKDYAPLQLTSVNMQKVALAADTEGATLFVNGIKVPYAAFNGRLFAPVTLQATPPAGYAFTGWRKSAVTLSPLVQVNDTWKYYDKGQLSGNSWSSTSFNDASWIVGQAPLGYSMTGVRTTIGYGGNAQQKNPTAYFRKTVTLDTAPGTNDSFLLNYQVDDGCVIWINGQEAGRVNMPSGTIGYTTFSSTYAGSEPLTGTLELPASLFKKGSNVIAVEVHNTSYTSSDLFWACELYASVGGGSEQTLLTDAVITLPADGNMSLTACFRPLTVEERQQQQLTPVCINEVSPDNGIYVNDHYKRNDWIELYNTTDGDIDVSGMYLTDNLSKPTKYQITATDGVTTVIPAHGYLVVWCDNLDPKTQLHATFKLDAKGGDVLLTAADGSWSNRFTYPLLRQDETAGRYPDGHADVLLMNVPTIAQANIASTYSTPVVQPGTTAIRDLMADGAPQLSIRYASDNLLVTSPQPDRLQVAVANLAGQTVARLTVRSHDGQAEVSVGHLSAGVYLATVTDSHGHKAVCKFVKR